MNLKSLTSFVLGLVIGAALLFTFERAPHIGNLFRSQAETMQASVPGNWKGKVEIGGANVDFSLVVKNNGNSLSGVISSAQVGAIPCNNLSVDPLGNISFSVHVQDKEANFTGKLTPDTNSMAGNITSSFGGGTWSLAKNKS